METARWPCRDPLSCRYRRQWISSPPALINGETEARYHSPGRTYIRPRCKGQGYAFCSRHGWLKDPSGTSIRQGPRHWRVLVGRFACGGPNDYEIKNAIHPGTRQLVPLRTHKASTTHKDTHALQRLWPPCHALPTATREAAPGK